MNATKKAVIEAQILILELEIKALDNSIGRLVEGGDAALDLAGERGRKLYVKSRLEVMLHDG